MRHSDARPAALTTGGLVAAHRSLVVRRLGQESALQHPIDLFLELGRLRADSLTNPDVRAEIAKRHDSVPV